MEVYPSLGRRRVTRETSPDGGPGHVPVFGEGRTGAGLPGGYPSQIPSVVRGGVM